MAAIINKAQDIISGTGRGKTVLITGGSGFVAAHVLNSFLHQGYNVRATVRSNETAEKVKKSHSKYVDQLSFAIVKDVAEDGAFDEAVKGVDGVSIFFPKDLNGNQLTFLRSFTLLLHS